MLYAESLPIHHAVKFLEHVLHNAAVAVQDPPLAGRRLVGATDAGGMNAVGREQKCENWSDRYGEQPVFNMLVPFSASI